jgi:hypothetical protein
MSTPTDLRGGAPSENGDDRFLLGRKGLAEAASFEAFDKAATLIQTAAADGDCEALCLLATMEAVGAGRPRDWHRALGYLADAAGRGSDHARGQLRLLARMSGAAETAGEDWQAMAGRIDVAALLQTPAAEPLSEQPRLRVFREFARAEECRWLIEQLRPKLHRAVVWADSTGEPIEDDYRSNRAAEIPLQDMDVVIEVLRARISAATRLPEFIFEIPQLMHYRVGEEFKPHHDFLDPEKPGFAIDYARRGQRMGTFLIFLNDDFDGGATEFPKAGLSFRGRTGDALFFANVTRDGKPDPLTLHAGRPPTSGEKWILSQWIRERPPAESVATPAGA